MNIDVQDASAQLTQSQKFLRYRSVPHSAANVSAPQAAPPPPPPPSLPQAPQTSVARLPSRYHRRPPATQSAPPRNIPQIPQNHDHTTLPRTRGKTIDEGVDEDEQVAPNRQDGLR